jgi:hypothetical protein
MDANGGLAVPKKNRSSLADIKDQANTAAGR